MKKKEENKNMKRDKRKEKKKLKEMKSERSKTKKEKKNCKNNENNSLIVILTKKKSIFVKLELIIARNLNQKTLQSS